MVVKPSARKSARHRNAAASPAGRLGRPGLDRPGQSTDSRAVALDRVLSESEHEDLVGGQVGQIAGHVRGLRLCERRRIGQHRIGPKQTARSGAPGRGVAKIVEVRGLASGASAVASVGRNCACVVGRRTSVQDVAQGVRRLPQRRQGHPHMRSLCGQRRPPLPCAVTMPPRRGDCRRRGQVAIHAGHTESLFRIWIGSRGSTRT